MPFLIPLSIPDRGFCFNYEEIVMSNELYANVHLESSCASDTKLAFGSLKSNDSTMRRSMGVLEERLDAGEITEGVPFPLWVVVNRGKARLNTFIPAFAAPAPVAAAIAAAVEGEQAPVDTSTFEDDDIPF